MSVSFVLTLPVLVQALHAANGQHTLIIYIRNKTNMSERLVKIYLANSMAEFEGCNVVVF